MNEPTNDFTEYVKQAARLIDLSIAPEYLPGTIENMARIAAVATLVTEFELPEDLESASTFEP
jgi:Protein of unknown function (DUF4089)